MDEISRRTEKNARLSKEDVGIKIKYGKMLS